MQIIKREELPEQRQVRLTIAVDKDTWQASLARCYQGVKSVCPVAGEPTRENLEQAYGPEFLYQEAVNDTYPQALVEAISQSDIQSIGNRLQMLNLTSRICNLLSQSLLRTLQLSILVKILLGILRRSHSRIKRNGNLLIGIIIQSLKRLTSILQPIPVSIDQLPVNLILLFLRSILHLLLLQTQLLTVTLQRSLHDPPQIRRLLMDTRQRILCRIISLQHL